MVRMSAPFVWRTRIRFIDTDASQRIHYTALFKHFEAAEEEFLRSFGQSFTSWETGNLGFPRVHVECDISGALAYGDEIDVQVAVDRVGNSSYTLLFLVFKAAAEVARGRIVVVCMNRDTQKSHPLPPGFGDSLRARLASAG